MARPILSVLDQAPISEGFSGADAIRNALDLARRTEAMGYHRYWVAEHHGTPALACASPEALIGPIAVTTSTIRVGSGGVMLPHYSPLKVAETFSMLSAIAPGRIDLGVGRAAGTDPTTTLALQRDRRQAAPDDFPSQLAELMAYLHDEMPQGHPFRHLSRLPGKPEAPELWLLGSSAQSGIWAAEIGVPYAFADFINPLGAPIVDRYRREFMPSTRAENPYVIAGVWVICADTDDEAKRLAASANMMFRLLFRGQLTEIPPVDKALEFLERDQPSPQMSGMRRRTIVGSPATVREKLEEVALEYSADELMIVTITWDHAARVRSYELLMDAWMSSDSG